MCSALLFMSLLSPSKAWAHRYHHCGGCPFFDGFFGLSYTATTILRICDTSHHHHCHHHCYWKKEGTKILADIDHYKKNQEIRPLLEKSLGKLSEQIQALSANEKIEILEAAIKSHLDQSEDQENLRKDDLEK